MTTRTRNRAAAGRGAPGGDVGVGWWRLVAVLPAVAGSVLVIAAGCVLAADRAALVVALLSVWAGGAGLTLTRVGERVMVRLVCGYRPARGSRRVVLHAAAQRVAAAAGVPAGRVDVYLCRSGAVNAFAVGGHSVAVTTRVLDDGEDSAARRHGQVVIEALLAHELGHLAQPGTRYLPALCWLAAPWRLTTRLLLGLSWVLAGRPRPGPLLAVVAAAGVGLGVAQLAAQGRWAGVAGLVVGGVCLLGCPLLAAAASRGAERAADTYAAACGYGPALAFALTHLIDERPRRRLAGRLLADHPDPASRADALDPANQGHIAG